MATEKKTGEAKPCRRCNKPAAKCGYTEKRIQIHDWICLDCMRQRTTERRAAQGLTARPARAKKPRADKAAAEAARVAEAARKIEQKRLAKNAAQKRYRERLKQSKTAPGPMPEANVA